MIYEMARIDVIKGKEAAFEEAVEQALPLFHRAKGCKSVALHRTVEHPSHYVLLVQWENLDDHMVLFRYSADFQTWRGLAGPFFEKPPVVTHTEIAVQ